MNEFSENKFTGGTDQVDGKMESPTLSSILDKIRNLNESQNENNVDLGNIVSTLKPYNLEEAEMSSKPVDVLGVIGELDRAVDILRNDMNKGSSMIRRIREIL